MLYQLDTDPDLSGRTTEVGKKKVIVVSTNGTILKVLRELGSQVEAVLLKKNYNLESLQAVVKRGREWQGGVKDLAEKLGAISQKEEKAEKPFSDEATYRRQRRNLIWRWGLLLSAGFALFWGIWYLVTGSVPAVDKILWNRGNEDRPDVYWQLPFALSRWWDALFVPICSTILIILVRWVQSEKNKDLVFGLVFGLGLGLAFGLGLGLAFGLGLGLAFGLVVGLVVGLAFGLVFGLAFGLVFGLGLGLASGLAFGLGLGLASGLAFGLGLGLVFGLVVGLASVLGLGLAFGLVFGLKYTFSGVNWRRLSTWLAGH